MSAAEEWIQSGRRTDAEGPMANSGAMEKPILVLALPQVPGLAQASPGNLGGRRDPWENVTPAPLAVRRPVHQPSRQRSQVLQHWEGTVLDIEGAHFVCRLRDLLTPERGEERATIDLADVPDPDVALVEPGAVFDWSIGYQVEPHGQKTVVSSIRFRRLPAWTQRELERARRLGSEYDDIFGATT